MKTLYFIITALFFSVTTLDQQFVDKAVIEFEVSTNLKKT